MKMLTTLLVASLRVLLVGGGLASLAHAQVAPELENYTSSVGEFSAQVIRQSESPNGALIVGLHGYGSDVSQIAGLVNVAPETSHSLIALRAPNALDIGGYAWFPADTTTRSDPAAQESLVSAADMVAASIGELILSSGSDPDNVFVVGFSQGASLSLAMALSHPDAATGYIGFSGAMPVFAPDLVVEAQSRAPVLLGYGTRDNRVRPEDVDATVAALAKAGVSVTLETFNAPHVVSSAGRRAIAAWIDDRVSGQPLPTSTPLPLAITAGPDVEADGDVVELAFASALDRGAVIGNLDGSVEIYKFFDYNCGVCRIAHKQMPDFIADWPGDIRVTAVDVPLLGPGSREASALTFGLSEPDDYDAIYHSFMSARGQITANRAVSMMAKLGITHENRDPLKALTEHQEAFRINAAAMRSLGIQGTPGFLVRLPDGREAVFTGWDPAGMAAFINSSKP